MSTTPNRQCWSCRGPLLPGKTRYYRALSEDGTWRHEIAEITHGEKVNQYSLHALRRIVEDRVNEHLRRVREWSSRDRPVPRPERDRSVPSPALEIGLCGRASCARMMIRWFSAFEAGIKVEQPQVVPFRLCLSSPHHDPEDPDLYDPSRRRRGKRREEKKRRRGGQGDRDTSLRRGEPPE